MSYYHCPVCLGKFKIGNECDCWKRKEKKEG